MRRLFAIISLILCACFLFGCAGTPVIYHDEDCGCDVPDGSLKTGIALVTALTKDSKSATDSASGLIEYDVTVAAVLVDKSGVIRACTLDSIGSKVSFDKAGHITSLPTEVKSKNEIGDDYGMVAWGGAKSEWYVQAKAVADFAVGKTIAQFKEGTAISSETGKPTDADLASAATIYIGGYASAIEAAVTNATYLGAMEGDTLKFASMASYSTSSSKDATADKNGQTQLEVDITAVSVKDGVITSCVFDSVQAKAEFDSAGALVTAAKTSFKTKNQLGSAYGMVQYAGAKAEWNAQAASFAKYVTGKTPAQVAGIAVDAGTKPTEADIASSVTIAVGGFQALIAKATA